MDSDFQRELAALINLHSLENGSNTPDFILAQFLVSALYAWNVAVARRQEWYGEPLKILSSTAVPAAPSTFPGPREIREGDTSAADNRLSHGNKLLRWSGRRLRVLRASA